LYYSIRTYKSKYEAMPPPKINRRRGSYICPAHAEVIPWAPTSEGLLQSALGGIGAYGGIAPRVASRIVQIDSGLLRGGYAVLPFLRHQGQPPTSSTPLYIQKSPHSEVR